MSRKLEDYPKNGRKYLVIIYLDKNLVSRIYKEHLQLSHKKTNHPVKNWAGVSVVAQGGKDPVLSL